MVTRERIARSLISAAAKILREQETSFVFLIEDKDEGIQNIHSISEDSLLRCIISTLEKIRG